MAFLQSMWQNSAQTMQGTEKDNMAFTKGQPSGSTASADTSVIGKCMHIKGNMTGSGDVELLGSVSGDIKISGKLHVAGSITGDSSAGEIYTESAKIVGEVKSESSVEIGSGSIVIGNIFAASAVIAGAVKGNIDVHGPVLLDASAIVMGDIRSESLEILSGAVVEGMCSQSYGSRQAESVFSGLENPAQGALGEKEEPAQAEPEEKEGPAQGKPEGKGETAQGKPGERVQAVQGKPGEKMQTAQGKPEDKVGAAQQGKPEGKGEAAQGKLKEKEGTTQG